MMWKKAKTCEFLSVLNKNVDVVSDLSEASRAKDGVGIVDEIKQIRNHTVINGFIQRCQKTCLFITKEPITHTVIPVFLKHQYRGGGGGGRRVALSPWSARVLVKRLWVRVPLWPSAPYCRPLPTGWVGIGIMWPAETDVMVSPSVSYVATRKIVRC